MKDKKYFTETGFLTPEGKELISGFEAEITKILNQVDGEQPVRIMGSILTKLVGEAVSSKLLKILTAKNKKEKILSDLFKMTDEEFQKYLDDKYRPTYGETWTFKVSLTKEEGIRYQPIVSKNTAEAMKESNRIMQDFWTLKSHSGVRTK